MKLIRNIVFLAVLAFGASYVYQTKLQDVVSRQSPTTQKLADQVLGSATSYVMKQASAGAELAQNAIYKKTSEPLVREFRKLPIGQQEVIKKQICEDSKSKTKESDE